MTYVKKYWKLGLASILFVVGILAFSGCMNGAPPTAFESKFYDVKTNWTESHITNTVTQYSTNVVSVTNVQTVHLLDGSTSNQVTVASSPVVSHLEVSSVTTNWTPWFEWSTNQRAKDTAAAGGTIGNMFGIPFIGTAGTLLFSLWGWLRTSRRSANTGAALVQIVETGRELLKQIPNGSSYDAAFVNFMQKHQTDTGTITQIAKILQSSVSNDSAKIASQDIIDLVTGATSVIPTSQPTQRSSQSPQVGI